MFRGDSIKIVRNLGRRRWRDTFAH